MKIILASSSPRRKDIMEQVGIPFEVRVSEVDENIGITKPDLLVKALSKLKAGAVLKEILKEDKNAECAVIGADTVVALDNEVLGKPKDDLDAKRMIKAQSGQKSAVYTGVTVLIRKNGKTKKDTFAVKTKIEMVEVSDECIDAYIASGEPRDKAGAYGIQGRFAQYVKKIDGDYYNIVGFPICPIAECLRKHGVIK